jgi:3-oxoacyl-[acyl-carrier-protein] synthase-3
MLPRRVYLHHVTHYLPETVLDNAFLEGILDTTDAWIRGRVGIAERRVMNDYRGSFPVFEIARRAVDRLVATTGFDLRTVDLILSASCTDDLQYPGPGNMISQHYGLSVPAFQLKNACSSVVYALEVARGLLQLGTYRRILIVNGEPFTMQTDYADRTSAILFGDGASAMVVSSEPGALELVDVAIGGRGACVINGTAPGARPERSIRDVFPAAAGTQDDEPFSGVAPRFGRFQQIGREVFDFVVNDMPREIAGFLASRQLSIDDVDWFIGHQANLSMLDGLCKNLGVPASKHLFNIDRYGNTGSAGWVTVLSESLAEQRFAPGDQLLVSVYGGGLAWGSLLARAA